MNTMTRSEQKKYLILLVILGLAIGFLSVCGKSERHNFVVSHGAIIRGDTTRKEIALVFTGGDFSDGGDHIRDVLKGENVLAGFFFTGDFYRNKKTSRLVQTLVENGHYLGPHSDRHLLYCSWKDRDSTLVTKDQFVRDILNNYREMKRFGISRRDAPFFIPPYEWYNETTVQWAQEAGLILFNFTPGTLSNADYTTPDMKNYRDSETIYQSILTYEENHIEGLNGFILLVHIGSHPDRKDKFYLMLKPLVAELKNRGYRFVRIDKLIGK